MKKHFNPPLGYTIIELLVVLVIIAILAVLAINAYNSFTVRSRVTELLNISANAKAIVSEYRMTHGQMPTASDLSLPSFQTKFVQNLLVGDQGQIIVTGNQTQLGIDSPLSLTLTPTYSNGAVIWVCTASGAPEYIPSACR